MTLSPTGGNDEPPLTAPERPDGASGWAWDRGVGGPCDLPLEGGHDVDPDASVSERSRAAADLVDGEKGIGGPGPGCAESIGVPKDNKSSGMTPLGGGCCMLCGGPPWLEVKGQGSLNKGGSGGEGLTDGPWGKIDG